MPDPEVERAAQFLATHAVLLLGLGLLAALVACGAVISAVRLASRFRDSLLRAFTVFVQPALRHRLVNQALTRTSVLIPNAYLGLHLTLGFLLAVAVMMFAALAGEILAGGEMTQFDVAFARALQDEKIPSWDRLFSVVSWFGSRAALTLATLAVAVFLFFRRSLVWALAWTAAQGGGGLLNIILKGTFERTRPEFADPILTSSSWSFPSGHAMGTFIFCGLACYLVLRDRRSWTSSSIALGLTVAWCVVMGFSRLYLGVHFASDVIAGLLAGAAWVAVCASALEVVRRSGSGSHSWCRPRGRYRG